MGSVDGRGSGSVGADGCGLRAACCVVRGTWCRGCAGGNELDLDAGQVEGGDAGDDGGQAVFEPGHGVVVPGLDGQGLAVKGERPAAQEAVVEGATGHGQLEGGQSLDPDLFP